MAKFSVESFTEMRDRLMGVHGWCRRVATIAARYYMYIEDRDDLRHRTQSQPCFRDYEHPPELSLGEAREIVVMH